MIIKKKKQQLEEDAVLQDAVEQKQVEEEQTVDLTVKYCGGRGEVIVPTVKE